MSMEVKIIAENNRYSLEENINNFIMRIPTSNIFDIKFSSSKAMSNGSSYENYSAMIIYER